MESASPIQRFVFHLPALVLTVWGTVMIHVAASGRISMFLAPVFRPFVLIAGILLLLLALGHVIYYQPAPPPRRRREDDPPPPSLSSEAGRWLVLLVPVVIAAVLAPNRFSEKILLSRGVQMTPAAARSDADPILAELREILAQQPEGEALRLTLYDVMALSTTPEAGELLREQPVQLEGQFESGRDGTWRLIEVMVFCCAADAVPMGITVRGPEPQGLETLDWIAVTGFLRFQGAGNRHQAEIIEPSVERIAEPEDAFLPY